MPSRPPVLRRIALALAASLTGSLLVAGAAPAPAAAPATVRSERAAEASYRVVEQERPAGLRSHTVVRPANLRQVPGRLPVIVWENGSCRNVIDESIVFLHEMAAKGFVVIAKGYTGGGKVTPKPTPTTLMRNAITWAQKANRTKGSRYYRKLDLGSVTAMGYSCGGFTSFEAASVDKRIRSIFVINSSTDLVGLSSSWLDDIDVPVALVNGGPTDLTFPAGMVNSLFANKMPFWHAERVFLDSGHNEFWQQGQVPNQSWDPTSHDPNTYWQPLLADMAETWMDYTVGSGSRASKRYLFGSPCGFCADDPLWLVSSKGWSGFQTRS